MYASRFCFLKHLIFIFKILNDSKFVRIKQNPTGRVKNFMNVNSFQINKNEQF